MGRGREEEMLSEILLRLLDGPAGIEELSAVLGVRSSRVRYLVRALVGDGLARESGGVVELTEEGREALELFLRLLFAKLVEDAEKRLGKSTLEV